MSDWAEVTVGDIASGSPNALATGPFGSAISSKFFQAFGVPVIRGSNLTDAIGVRLIEADFAFLSPKKAAEFSRSIARRGDLVFTCWGTVGQVGLIDQRARYDEYVISNKQMKLTPDANKADSLFLYYLFSSPAVYGEIKNQAIGSSVPGFNLGQLKSFRIRLPHINNQKAIARILSALDDKIELNRKMNETLEEMARALFKSWFVDFDPVHAKAAGKKPYGMDDATAALFPDGFEESELGLIPLQWRLEPLEKLAKVIMGNSPNGESYNEHGSGTPLVNGPAEYGDYFPIKRKWTTAPTRLSSEGDLLLCVRGSTTGRRVKADGVYCLGRGVCGIRAYYQTFIDLAVDQGMDRLLAQATGSVFPNLSGPTLAGFPLLTPSGAVCTAFEGNARVWTNRAAANHRQSRALAELRDTLLPKFLSGELSVKDAEHLVGDAV